MASTQLHPQAPAPSAPDDASGSAPSPRVPALVLEPLDHSAPPRNESSAHRLWRKRRKVRQLAGVLYVFLLTWLGTPARAHWIAGASFVVLGMLVRLWASGLVRKNDVLATSGPYAFVRHPLYVGNVLIGLGFCQASGLWWSWLGFAALFAVLYPVTIRYEDKKLERLFGEPWRRWASVTRALWPRLTPYVDREAPAAPASWSLKLSLGRNGEPVHVLVGLVCLWILAGRIPAL